MSIINDVRIKQDWGPDGYKFEVLGPEDEPTEGPAELIRLVISGLRDVLNEHYEAKMQGRLPFPCDPADCKDLLMQGLLLPRSTNPGMLDRWVITARGKRVVDWLRGNGPPGPPLGTPKWARALRSGSASAIKATSGIVYKPNVPRVAP